MATLLDAPIDLAVTLRQAGDGLAIDIERATWKSLARRRGAAAADRDHGSASAICDWP